MEAEACAEKLSRFQREALAKIGEFGEAGMWVHGSGVNWISVALMLRKKAAPDLLEGVPGKANHCRLTDLGKQVIALNPAAPHSKPEFLEFLLGDI